MFHTKFHPNPSGSSLVEFCGQRELDRPMYVHSLHIVRKMDIEQKKIWKLPRSFLEILLTYPIYCLGDIGVGGKSNTEMGQRVVKMQDMTVWNVFDSGRGPVEDLWRTVVGLQDPYKSAKGLFASQVGLWTLELVHPSTFWCWITI